MAEVKYCAFLGMERNRESTGCMGDACGMWDDQGSCCSIKTIAEFTRLGMTNIAGGVDRMQNSLDSRLADLFGKLDQLLMSTR